MSSGLVMATWSVQPKPAGTLAYVEVDLTWQLDPLSCLRQS